MLPRSRRYCCIIGVSASRMIPELNHAARIASLNWSKRLNGTAVFMTGKSAPRWDIQIFLIQPRLAECGPNQTQWCADVWHAISRRANLHCKVDQGGPARGDLRSVKR